MKKPLMLALLLGALGSGLAQADACVPERAPASAWGANPITTYLIAALAPDKLIGWNFAPPPEARGFFPAATLERPVVGGWFGQGKTPNLETLAALKPDISLVSGATVAVKNSVHALEQLGLASCEIRADHVDDYPAALRKAGKALGVAERGEQMAVMAEHLLAARQKSSLNPAPRIYYAEGPDGLASECDGSIHAEVITLAGGVNVHRCPGDSGKDRFGMVRVDFEQLVSYDPDWIVTQDMSFARKLKGDARWKSLRAVREGRVLLMPQVPFRWMDRPPSYMRLLAMHWLAERIQPKPYALDVPKATQDFFALFFQRELDAHAVQAILNPEVH
ncbi:MAG TPA: ABC transporter substrate-binding protein [bacterium]|nr:ABC transporter substrate-binding protein [bacterium]